MVPHSALAGAASWLVSGKFLSLALLKDISDALGKHFHAEDECMSYVCGRVAALS